jgi:hypothetical protein
MPLSLEQAAERYRMALYCAAVTGLKNSHKAILCLKTSWIYRDLNDKANELLFLKNAVTGYKEAYKTESFPIGSMDEQTTQYLIGELLRRCGESSESMRWISQVVVSRNVSPKLKERALLVRDLIRENSTT